MLHCLVERKKKSLSKGKKPKAVTFHQSVEETYSKCKRILTDIKA